MQFHTSICACLLCSPTAYINESYKNMQEAPSFKKNVMFPTKPIFTVCNCSYTIKDNHHRYDTHRVI